MSNYTASEKYGIPEMYLDAQEGVESYQVHLSSTQLSAPHRPARHQYSLTSKTIRYFRSAWTAITRIGATSKSHSHAPQNFNSIHSRVEAYDEKHLFCPNHLSTPVGKSIAVTIDGLIIGHVTIPDAFAPNIVGAALSEDSKSVALTTETPPACEHPNVQIHAPSPVSPPKSEGAHEQCPTFDEETIRFASAFLPYGKPLALWSASGAKITSSQSARATPATIRRKTRIAPGGILQLPSIHGPKDVYMLGYADVFGRGTHHPLRCWAASLTRESAGTGLFVKCAPHVEAVGYQPAVIL